MNWNKFVKNNKILPIEEAVASLFSVEYTYGFGVYENIRVKENFPYFMDDHVERLFYSAKQIGLEHQFTKENIRKVINELIAELSKKEKITLNLKILLIGAKEPKDAELYILPLSPFFSDKKTYNEGANLITKIYERWLPQAKTLNMLPSYIYYSEARKKGCYDILFLDNAKRILEGSRTNFFLIKGNEITTAPEALVLSGVMRKHVIKVAKQNGFTVTERTVPVSELKKYDCAFLTSTSSKILPIRKIDEFEFKEIPIGLKNLMKFFDEYLGSQVRQK